MLCKRLQPSPAITYYAHNVSRPQHGDAHNAGHKQRGTWASRPRKKMFDIFPLLPKHYCVIAAHAASRARRPRPP